MFVIKRNGMNEEVQFDKISSRIINLLTPKEQKICDSNTIAQKVVQSIYDGITSEELDLESAKICSNLCTINPLYGELGGRILASSLHKKTLDSFTDCMNAIQQDTIILDPTWLQWINENKNAIDGMIDRTRDYMYDYFGFKTLERSYLLKSYKTNSIYERPQYLFMRVASFINCGNLEMTRATYDLLSTKQYTHATPTLFNAGTMRPQLSSCFLLNTKDSLEGITKTWNQVSMISKWAGGIGLHISNIRSKGSIIRSTNGTSSGIVPMLQVYNNIARYINQAGKRKGSFAIYLEPHHADILDFLELRKNTGAETERTRDLFTALWISDLFMETVEADGDWFLMCPDECPYLNERYGEEYNILYRKYVEQGKYREKIKARKLMEKIMDSQFETGTPYMLYKDSINQKSNQKNIGIVKSSNLCAEIVEVSNDTEHAVCNLASICLNQSLVKFNCTKEFVIYTKPDCIYCVYAKRFMEYNSYPFIERTSVDQNVISLKKIKCEDGVCRIGSITYPLIYYDNCYVGGFNELVHLTASTYSFDNLWETSYTAAINLNRVIDVNFYPTEETKCSNLRNRPIGLGIQGLSDTLTQMRIPFDSVRAVEFNEQMMETIYNAAMTASKDIAKSRHQGIKYFISNISKTYLYEPLPTYYDKKYYINCYNTSQPIGIDMIERLNSIYHNLRINSCEINDAFGTYSSYTNSPLSKGIFQFDMWEHKPKYYNWDELREEIKKYGVRNSLVVALMPTASTSQIMGNNECFEHQTSNIYTRRTIAGDFQLVNKNMVEDLLSIGLWNNDLKQIIVGCNGSVNREYKLLQDIPQIFREQYKTIWEIKQIWVLKHARARAPFVDQTQSMNIFMDRPDYKKLYSCHMWGWKNGLKTGMYYLRTNAAEDAVKVTVDPTLLSNNECTSCSA
jgi:ribonucleoside-diphosphate reductase alpha subunit